MPIKIQSDLPAREILDNENIFVMDEYRAMHQNIRPLQICILNLMPVKQDTELQLLRSLSNTPLQVDVTFMKMNSHLSLNTSVTHLNKFYNTFNELKENKYDDDIFFQKYSQMSRSQQGLAGAGEWETLRKLLPDFKDKRVLDLGCGYGWHCIYAMEHGASSVVGVDISHKMLEVAKEKTHFPQVEYKCCAIEDVEFPEESFDVILSSLAFHYVADYEILVKKIYRILKSGGKLVFTVEHPVFTAYGTQDWYYNKKGEILHFPVDNYYYEGKRTAVFLGEKVTKFHRTLTTYLNTLLSNGFIINHIVEPQPPEYMMDIPGMQDEMRRPMMLIVSANKKVDR